MEVELGVFNESKTEEDGAKFGMQEPNWKIVSLNVT